MFNAALRMETTSSKKPKLSGNCKSFINSEEIKTSALFSVFVTHCFEKVVIPDQIVVLKLGGGLGSQWLLNKQLPKLQVERMRETAIKVTTQ